MYAVFWCAYSNAVFLSSTLDTVLVVYGLYCPHVTPPCVSHVLLQSGHLGIVDWHLHIIQEYADGGSLYDALLRRR